MLRSFFFSYWPNDQKEQLLSQEENKRIELQKSRKKQFKQQHQILLI